MFSKIRLITSLCFLVAVGCSNPTHAEVSSREARLLQEFDGWAALIDEKYQLATILEDHSVPDDYILIALLRTNHSSPLEYFVLELKPRVSIEYHDVATQVSRSCSTKLSSVNQPLIDRLGRTISKTKRTSAHPVYVLLQQRSGEEIATRISDDADEKELNTQLKSVLLYLYKTLITECSEIN